MSVRNKPKKRPAHFDPFKGSVPQRSELLRPQANSSAPPMPLPRPSVPPPLLPPPLPRGPRTRIARDGRGCRVNAEASAAVARELAPLAGFLGLLVIDLAECSAIDSHGVMGSSHTQHARSLAQTLLDLNQVQARAGSRDIIEEVVTTTPDRLHLLRVIARFDVALHLLLDREGAGLGLARIVLAEAADALEGRLASRTPNP